MNCYKCKHWEVSRGCVNYSDIENRYGDCVIRGPGEIHIDGNACVDVYLTDAFDMCSKFESIREVE